MKPGVLAADPGLAMNTLEILAAWVGVAGREPSDVRPGERVPIGVAHRDRFSSLNSAELGPVLVSNDEGVAVDDLERIHGEARISGQHRRRSMERRRRRPSLLALLLQV